MSYQSELNEDNRWAALNKLKLAVILTVAAGYGACQLSGPATKVYNGAKDRVLHAFGLPSDPDHQP